MYFGSINGENKHYGTPRNPSAPDRVPGGSSSGSAVAVGAGLVDFSLGELRLSSMIFFCFSCLYFCNLEQNFSVLQELTLEEV